MADQLIPRTLLNDLLTRAFPAARASDRPTASLRWFRYFAKRGEPIDPASPELLTWYTGELDPAELRKVTPKQLRSRMSTEVENLRKKLQAHPVPAGSGQIVTVQRGQWQLVLESLLPVRKAPAVERFGGGRRIAPRTLFQPFLQSTQEVWVAVPASPNGMVDSIYLDIFALLSNRWAQDGLRLAPRVGFAGVPAIVPGDNSLIGVGTRANNPYIRFLAEALGNEPLPVGETRLTRGKLPGGAWAMTLESERPADALALLSQVLAGAAGWRSEGGRIWTSAEQESGLDLQLQNR